MKPSRFHLVAGALALAVMLSAQPAAAQYDAKQKYLGAHVGLSGVGSSTTLGVNGEVSYSDKISIGAWMDWWSYGDDFGTVNWDVTYIALAGTGAYHFKIENNSKLDPFLGLALGYFIVSTSTNIPGANYSGDDSRLFLGGFGGLRYFFKPNMAGVVRAGFGASTLTLGLDFKL
jgi:hypothetical protein